MLYTVKLISPWPVSGGFCCFWLVVGLLFLLDLGLSGRGALALLGFRYSAAHGTDGCLSGRPLRSRVFPVSSHVRPHEGFWAIEGREFGALESRSLSKDSLCCSRTHCCKKTLLRCTNSLFIISKLSRSRTKWAPGACCAFSKHEVVTMFRVTEIPNK